MTPMNRRSVLKGLATLPALASLRLQAQVPTSPKSAGKANAKPCFPHPVEMNYVNVVFHGTWIYLLYPDHVRAIAPRIESNSTNPATHVAGMGGIAGIEDVLPAGEYEIGNLQAAPSLPPPDPWQSIVIDAGKAGIRKLDLSPANLYYSIKLPLPETMLPVGQMTLGMKAGSGQLFKTPKGYLDTIFNRSGQRYSSVQVLTYRLVPKEKLTQVEEPNTGCYSDACYSLQTAPPIPDSFVPEFRPPLSSSVKTGQTSPKPVPFANTYIAASVPGYRQYHLAYVVRRTEESGEHENHSFGRMMSTLGIDVRASFCDYRFGELPMALPIGLSHEQANLDAFPNEIRQPLFNFNGWYSNDEVKKRFVDLLQQGVLDQWLSTESLSWQGPAANALQIEPLFTKFLADFSDYSKPIGNCRSGSVIVTNPPAS